MWARRALFRAFRARAGLTRKTEIRVGTASGVIVRSSIGVRHSGNGVPVFEPTDIPFFAPARALTYHLDVGDRTVEIALFRWQSHAVQMVPDVKIAPVQTEGAQIELHPRFPPASTRATCK